MLPGYICSPFGTRLIQHIKKEANRCDKKRTLKLVFDVTETLAIDHRPNEGKIC